jgi:hypothetical protein
LQVKAQLRHGNADLAKATLAKESLLGELRNQIAIIRYALCSSTHLDSLAVYPL